MEGDQGDTSVHGSDDKFRNDPMHELYDESPVVTRAVDVVAKLGIVVANAS